MIIPRGHASRQYGIGLIEILITLLIFSVGVLAIAGLQAVAKRNNYDAIQRTTAANLARFIVSSMRANPQGRAGYLVPENNPLGSRGGSSTPDTNCLADNCSPAELAAFDLHEWEQALDGASDVVVEAAENGGTRTIQTGGLVSPSACVTGPAGGGAGFYTVIVAWRGITQLDGSDTAVDCGAGRGLYGRVRGDGTALDDSTAYRRYFEFRTYIAP